jgi:hypothetical protein
MTNETPMEDYNRMLIEQITSRAQQGFKANLVVPHYAVVHTGEDRILTIVPASSLSEDQPPAFGPRPFADCIQYVNRQLVVDPGKPRHPLLQSNDDTTHSARTRR